MLKLDPAHTMYTYVTKIFLFEVERWYLITQITLTIILYYNLLLAVEDLVISPSEVLGEVLEDISGPIAEMTM